MIRIPEIQIVDMRCRSSTISNVCVSVTSGLGTRNMRHITTAMVLKITSGTRSVFAELSEDAPNDMAMLIKALISI